jgi:hypothetical protein
VGNQSRPRRGCSRDHDPSIELEGVPRRLHTHISRPIQYPQGNSLTECVQEQAKDVVHRAKYPPLGGRTSGGSFHTQAFHLEGHGRTLTQEEYWANTNDATLIIAIIETKEGLENIDEIVQVKGLGGFGSRPRNLTLHTFAQIYSMDPTASDRQCQADAHADTPQTPYSSVSTTSPSHWAPSRSPTNESSMASRRSLTAPRRPASRSSPGRQGTRPKPPSSRATRGSWSGWICRFLQRPLPGSWPPQERQRGGDGISSLRSLQSIPITLLNTAIRDDSFETRAAAFI